MAEARLAAEHIGCDHTEVVLRSTDIIDVFEDFIDVLDQPSADGLNTYLVSKLACKDVKVALSGLGGDELFCGYAFFGWFNDKMAREKTSCLDRVFVQGHDRYPNRWTFSRIIKSGSVNDRLALMQRGYSDYVIRNMLSFGIRRNFTSGHVQRYIASLGLSDADQVFRASKYECKNYLLNTLLRDADAVSMGHGLEVRPVFLDHLLAEFALAMPSTSKWRNGIGKAVLKDAAKDLLPVNFFNRKKACFVLPTLRWMDEELKDMFAAIFHSRQAEMFFDGKFLDRMVCAGARADRQRSVWRIFVFLTWAEKHGLVLA